MIIHYIRTVCTITVALLSSLLVLVVDQSGQHRPMAVFKSAPSGQSTVYTSPRNGATPPFPQDEETYVCTLLYTTAVGDMWQTRDCQQRNTRQRSSLGDQLKSRSRPIKGVKQSELIPLITTPVSDSAGDEAKYLGPLYNPIRSFRPH